ncbi:hypothetical protein PsorP6_018980 [Peronosclerospora sorghi]|nr:hypothetical protein PsorP6_018980 [Peronosclerospora sorghi]
MRTASTPLVLQHRVVTVSYTDRFRRDADAHRPNSGSGGARHAPESQRPGERWLPRPDWLCDQVGCAGGRGVSICRGY